MSATDPSRRALSQLNVRLPSIDRDELRTIATRAGVSVNALLSAMVHAFLAEHPDGCPSSVITEARNIDSHRRRRPHLRRGAVR